MSERQVGYYSPEDVADGWLRAELGRTTDYKLDTLARPSIDTSKLDIPAIMHRHVEKFWMQYEVYFVREKWLRGRRFGRAWNRFKKWYNEYPLVLIPRVDIDTSESAPQEKSLAELCKAAGIPVEPAIMAARRGKFAAWRPARMGWHTSQATFDRWLEGYLTRRRAA